MASVTQQIQSNDETISRVNVAKVDYKFEIVVIPVSDVDRAKEFYARLGWRFDIDAGMHTLRPYSVCSNVCSYSFVIVILAQAMLG